MSSTQVAASREVLPGRQDLLWFHQCPNQIFRHVFIHTVIEPSHRRIDIQLRQHFLRHVCDFRNHQVHFDLIRKLPAPDLRHQVLPAVARRLPQSQQPADFESVFPSLTCILFPPRSILLPTHLPSVERVPKPSVKGGFSRLWPGGISFGPKFSLSRFLGSLIRGNQLPVLKTVLLSSALSKHDQVFLPEPKQVANFARPVVFPRIDLTSRIRVHNDRSDPTEALTSTKVWCSIRFIFPFRNTVPESGVLPVIDRISAAPYPFAIVLWLVAQAK